MPNSISRLGFAAALLGLVATAGTSLASQPLPEKSNSGSYLAGRTATKLGDNDLASDFFKEALKEDSNNPILIERVFLLELSEGDIPKAEATARPIARPRRPAGGSSNRRSGYQSNSCRIGGSTTANERLSSDSVNVPKAAASHFQRRRAGSIGAFK